ncbi:MAG: hypothetical protein KKB79_01870 [Nanoarchaeota archaeon]|nr:hypothetical protein [Nanoarchaeota archaeon]
MTLVAAVEDGSVYLRFGEGELYVKGFLDEGLSSMPSGLEYGGLVNYGEHLGRQRPFLLPLVHLQRLLCVSHNRFVSLDGENEARRTSEGELIVRRCKSLEISSCFEARFSKEECTVIMNYVKKLLENVG